MPPDRARPRCIAHLSDLHFGAIRDAALATLSDDLRAQQPDLVAVSGDLTLRAREAEFRAATAFLDSLGPPWVAVPGNHDIPHSDLIERFFRPFDRWRAFLGRETEPAWQDDSVIVVGINSVRAGGFYSDWSAGRINGTQLRRLAKIAAAAAGRSVIVMLHHPPQHPAAFAARRGLGRGAEAVKLFAARGVSAVLAGHLHEASVVPGPPIQVLAASALSWRDGGRGNAYNLVQVTAGRVHVTHRAFDGTAWQPQPAAPPELAETRPEGPAEVAIDR